MGYDMYWWRYVEEGQRNHDSTLEKLCNGIKDIPDLEKLPMARIRTRIGEMVKGDWHDDEFVSEEDAFELYTGDQHVHYCGYGDFENSLGRLVEVMTEFHCPAFDPQTGERHGEEIKV